MNTQTKVLVKQTKVWDAVGMLEIKKIVKNNDRDGLKKKKYG